MPNHAPDCGPSWRLPPRRLVPAVPTPLVTAPALGALAAASGNRTLAVLAVRAARLALLATIAPTLGTADRAVADSRADDRQPRGRGA